MKLDEIENVGIIAAIAGGAFLLWKSGVFQGLNSLGNGLSYIESGAIGENIAKTAVSSPSSQATIANGGSPVTIGQIAANTNPLTFLVGYADAVEGNASTVMLSLNVDATDNAFSKLGLTTAQVEALDNGIGDAQASALLQRLHYNTLSASDKATLYQYGWDGTCQYWNS